MIGGDLVHRSLIICAILSAMVSAVSPVWAANQLAMPFACKSKAGELTVTASPLRPYQIIGRREQRVYTACRDAGAPNCKTMMVHRFTISCGGIAVPWVNVAEKIRSDTIGASWLEDGQLNLLFRTSSGDKQRTARFVMPSGFAPVAEVGASLDRPTVVAALPVTPGAAIAADADATDAAVAAAAVAGVPSAGEAAMLEANTSVIPEPSWQTVVYPHGVETTGPGDGRLALTLMVVALLLTMALATFGIFRSRWRPAVNLNRVWPGAESLQVRRWWRVAIAPKLPRMNNETFYNGVDSVAALVVQVETSVGSLRSVGPLRETLFGELKNIRRRLASLKHSDNGPLSAARTSANLRNIVRDLERIRRIADSAAISIPGGGQGSRETVPKTAAEAYELLGINASASQATLKKIVDGLRMSWHPDLARDDDDRDLREERTKCINIAWDLITGKRAA